MNLFLCFYVKSFFEPCITQSDPVLSQPEVVIHKQGRRGINSPPVKAEEQALKSCMERNVQEDGHGWPPEPVQPQAQGGQQEDGSAHTGTLGMKNISLSSA